MSTVLRSVKVIDVNSEWNGRTLDLYVDDKGIIHEFDNQSFKKEINLHNASIFPGILDMAVNFCEPGLEQKETISSGVQAALAGGVTAVLQVPNVDPIIDSKETLSYVKTKASQEPIDFYVQGAISKKTSCKSLTEVLDMAENGADAFGDGYSNLWHSGLLLKSLQYLQHTDKILINTPYDKNLISHGLMHEGKVSTQNGMSGVPSLVEHMAIARDLEILKYSGGKLHFAQISCVESIEMIKNAKKQGLQVTCGVNYFHLIASEKALLDFDTNCKLMPPLRSATDKRALIKAVKDGIIDVIVSDHRPQEEDCKKLEFNYADNGKIGLQTMFISLKSNTDLSNEDLQRCLVVNPRLILNKPKATINTGEKANFFVYIEEKHKFRAEDVKSLSKNTSEIGQEFKYKIKATIKGLKTIQFGN
jgi:dihydroorotase